MLGQIISSCNRIKLFYDLGILGLAMHTLGLISISSEDLAAVVTPVVLGKDCLNAAQVDSTTAGGAHKCKLLI
jgi:hypothetical protein